MTTQTVAEIRVRDPLSEVTRKERRMLLMASLISITVAKTGLIPTKIETLGIEFGNSGRGTLLGVLACVTLYFLAAFTLYAASDFLAWRFAIMNFFREAKRRHSEAQSDPDAGQLGHDLVTVQYRHWFLFSGPVSVLRAVFEFVIPLIIAVYAVFTLWRAA